METQDRRLFSVVSMVIADDIIRLCEIQKRIIGDKDPSLSPITAEHWAASKKSAVHLILTSPWRSARLEGASATTAATLHCCLGQYQYPLGWSGFRTIPVPASFSTPLRGFHFGLVVDSVRHPFHYTSRQQRRMAQKLQLQLVGGRRRQTRVHPSPPTATAWKGLIPCDADESILADPDHRWEAAAE